MQGNKGARLTIAKRKSGERELDDNTILRRRTTLYKSGDRRYTIESNRASLRAKE